MIPPNMLNCMMYKGDFMKYILALSLLILTFHMTIDGARDNFTMIGIPLIVFFIKIFAFNNVIIKLGCIKVIYIYLNG